MTVLKTNIAWSLGYKILILSTLEPFMFFSVIYNNCYTFIMLCEHCNNHMWYHITTP